VPATDLGRLLVRCADRPGIVAAVSGFLHRQGANIVESDQYSTDPEDGTFFLRMVFHRDGFDADHAALRTAFATEVAEPFGMTWQLHAASKPKRVAIFVSRYEHCLLDLLWRVRRGELNAEVGIVVSNHPHLEDEVARFGIPYAYVAVGSEDKTEAEARQLALVGEGYDLIVLARYMQILSREFLDRAGAPIINIHHSFLPAFVGADPYRRAKERGVKVVGATAHYVVEELDAGPIIEQDTIRVTHRHDVPALERLGAEIERVVLARAVAAHCEDRVLVHGATTVVF
jgi:formyltetrahydrofolate deformylase